MMVGEKTEKGMMMLRVYPGIVAAWDKGDWGRQGWYPVMREAHSTKKTKLTGMQNQITECQTIK